MSISSYPEMYEQNKLIQTLRSKLRHLLELLYQETKHDLFLEYDFLISRYILLFSTIEKITYFEPEIFIYIDTDLSLLAENRIIEQLQHAFYDSYNLNITSLASQATNTFDLVISSSFLSTIKQLSSSESSIIYIAQELLPEDIKSIEQSLSSIHRGKMCTELSSREIIR